MQVYIYLAQPDLAEHLFGNDAYIGMSPVIKPDVGKFVHMLHTISWNCHCKANHHEVDKMDKILQVMKEKWNGMWFISACARAELFIVMSTKDANLMTSQICAFLKDLHRLLTLLT